MMSWSARLEALSWNFLARQAQPQTQTFTQVKSIQSKSLSASPEASAYEQAKRRCALFSSKPVANSFCLSEAKRRLKNPAPPSKPRSAYEKELASCRTLGKGPTIMECQRRARKKLDSPAAPANSTSPTSDLQRQLNNCRTLSKGAAISQCQKDVRKRFR
jgi:hypothetical protein